MAGEETIGRATVQLGADGSKLAPEMAAAMAKAQGALDRANKQMEKAQASTMKAIQGHIDKINATRPTNEMRMLEQAVLKLGGSSKLSGDQLKRVTAEVNALAAAGAKVPASLQGLTGMGSKLGAAFSSLTTGGGVSGALAAIGPAGLAAAGALGAVTLAGTKAFGAISDLASQAEQWSNTAASTGLGIDTVQQLSAMLEDAGIPAEALGSAMKALQKEIASGGEKVAKFGIDVEKLKGQTPEEQLRAMAKIISEIEDPTDRAAASVAAFKDAGTVLIPVMDGVATGADKMFAALGAEQIAALKQADDTLDAFGRKWDHTKKIVLSSVVQMIQGFKGFAGTIPIFLPSAAVAAGAAPGAPKPTSDAEAERKKRAAEFAQKAAHDKAERSAESARKKAADELLAVRRKYNELQASIVKATSDEASLMRDLDEQSKSLLATQEQIAKESLNAKKETRLRGGDMLPSVGGAGLWTTHQDVLDQEMENAAAKTDQVATATKDWTSTLGTLADNLNVLAQTTGGLTGKIVGFAASLASGLGGALAGLQGIKSSGGGLMGFLGKASGALGMVGSVVGLAGSLFKGLKSIFGGKSKEQKAAEAAAKKQAADDAKALKVETAQKKLAAAEQAKGFAESLQEKIAAGGMSEKLTAALQGFVGKMGEALGKLGLGIVDARLKDSKEFQGAAGAAGDVAGAMGAAREAGIADVGLQAAATGAAAAIQEQAIAAAREAGLSDMEAAKQGSLAIAAILKEQLNASIQSGTDLDANTMALLEEAKKNGINILADPAIESLAVQQKQLAVLEAIDQKFAGGGMATNLARESAKAAAEKDFGAASGFGPMITPNLGHGLGPRIQTHPGELAMVIPRSRMGASGLLSAASGLYSSPRGRMGRGGNTTTINLAISENPFQSTEGARALRSHTLKTVERETGKRLAALIASGRA